MYIVMVVVLTVVAPLVSTLIEGFATGWDAGLIAIAGKWWVFWGIGVRLFTAGISQVTRPQFTTKAILGQDDAGATQIVSELGYANLGMGAAGLLSLVFPAWAPAAAVAGGVFLFVAGVRHIVKPGKNTKEVVATLTDLLVGIVALVFAVWAAVVALS